MFPQKTPVPTPDYNEVIRKISVLETLIINLILPIQNIKNAIEQDDYFKDLINYMRKGIDINDSRLKFLLKDFEAQIKSAEEIISNNDLSIFASETKFIAKRMDEIEKHLKLISEKGLDQNVKLNFTVDGYELVKKQINYDPTEPIEEPNQDLIDLLKILNKREKNCVVHKLGLFSEKKQSFKGLEDILGIKSEQCRLMYKKCLRKLRHQSVRHLVEKIKNKLLYEEIMGKD